MKQEKRVNKKVVDPVILNLFQDLYQTDRKQIEMLKQVQHDVF